MFSMCRCWPRHAILTFNCSRRRVSTPACSTPCWLEVWLARCSLWWGARGVRKHAGFQRVQKCMCVFNVFNLEKCDRVQSVLVACRYDSRLKFAASCSTSAPGEHVTDMSNADVVIWPRRGFVICVQPELIANTVFERLSTYLHTKIAHLARAPTLLACSVVHRATPCSHAHTTHPVKTTSGMKYMSA